MNERTQQRGSKQAIGIRPERHFAGAALKSQFLELETVDTNYDTTAHSNKKFGYGKQVAFTIIYK